MCIYAMQFMSESMERLSQIFLKYKHFLRPCIHCMRVILWFFPQAQTFFPPVVFASAYQPSALRSARRFLQGCSCPGLFSVQAHEHLFFFCKEIDHESTGKSQHIFRKSHGCPRSCRDGCFSLYPESGPVDSDRLDQLSADDCHVRHGTDTEPVRFSACFFPAAGYSDRLCLSVYHHAAPGVCFGKTVSAG